MFCAQLKLAILLFALTKSSGQDAVNSPCELRNNEGTGQCTLIHGCRDPMPTGLPICGFNRTTPIVCCPVHYIPGQSGAQATTQQPVFPDVHGPRPSQRPPSGTSLGNRVGSGISRQKCEQYKRPVQQEVTALFLTPDASPVTHVVAKCDYSNIRLIVGGEEVQVGEFPHMAALGYGEAPNFEFNCGGSLISERFVMTAAHCTRTSQYGDPKVARLGEHDLQRDDDGASPLNVVIAEVVLHPDYLPPKKYNDIALLRLQRDVTFTSKIRPACLPVASPPANTNAVATGWGRIQYSEEASPKLLKVVFPLIAAETCSQLWANSVKTSTSQLPRGIDHDTMMCAGAIEGGKDTCLGDSGGPLSIASPNNECVHIIVGVTSFGKFCGFRNSPGIYTRVSHYVPWIESVVWP